MDHTPNEHIEASKIYTSVFLFSTTNFHGKFEACLNTNNIKLKKWSSSKAYKKSLPGIIETINLAKLPFFVHVLTAYGADIYQSRQHYIDELYLNRILSISDKAGETYYEFAFDDKTIITKEKIGLAALHISHFIIRSYYTFKHYCFEKDIPFVGNPFMLFHDRFASNNDNILPILVQLCVGMSLYHGYPTREIMLATYDKGNDASDIIFTDNLCGYFQDINNRGIDIANIIKPDNLVWEKWT